MSEASYVRLLVGEMVAEIDEDMLWTVTGKGETPESAPQLLDVLQRDYGKNWQPVGNLDRLLLTPYIPNLRIAAAAEAALEFGGKLDLGPSPNEIEDPDVQH